MHRLRMMTRKRPDPREALAAERKHAVEEMYRQGYKQMEIAKAVGISQARVSQIMANVERARTNKRRMLRTLKAEPARASA